ncbi:TetR/AcrR family transcriptional regulator [Streptomyces sp. NPDC002004]
MTDAPTSSPADGSHLGLRERKKIKTRTAIRSATYALISRQGYDATTIEQIAEAAEVSPSTVFRYFPTKEDIVLTDEYDPLLEDMLRARPTDEPLLDSLRAVMRHGFDIGMREEPEVTKLRTRLMLDVPAVRSRMTESMSVTSRILCRVIAERTGRHADDLEVRSYSMGIMGALMETSLYWAERGHRDELPDLVDRALTTIENGVGR